MNVIRRHRGTLGIALVVVACSVAAIAAAPTAQDLIQQARTHYDQHNYKSALGAADKALAADPKGDLLRKAQHLKALATCMWPKQSGYEYAKKIMKDHPPFATDAELWMAMGEDQRRRYPRKNAHEAFRRAAELFEKAGKHPRAADAWFKVAATLSESYFLPQPVAQRVVNQPWNWQAQRRHHVVEAGKVYKHIATLKIKDQRKAEALRLAGELNIRQGDWKLAEAGIALLARCVKEFPKTPQAPGAQFRIAETYRRFNRFVEAIAAARKVFQDFPQSDKWPERARNLIQEVKRPQIQLWIEKSYLPGEKAKVYWQSRNVKKLHLTAKSVDLIEAVKKIGEPGHLMGVLRSQKGQAVARWAFDTPDAGKHQVHQNVPSGEKQTTVPIDVPLKDSGAYLIEAAGVSPDGIETRGHCLVVFSPIAAVAKGDSDQVLLFAADARSSAPVGGADAAVVVRRWSGNGTSRSEHREGKTNDAGLVDLRTSSAPHCQWLAAVRKGDQQALCAEGRYRWWWWGYRQPYKVYGFTERPVYRPGHTVHFKQVIRAHKDGAYANEPDRKVRVTVHDPKGETIYAKDLITDKFGAVEGDFKLADKAPLGMYYIRVEIDGRNYGYNPGSQFRVEEYKKPEFKVAVSPAKSDYRVGDEMKIKINVRYYFGQPAIGAEVRFTVRKESYTHRYEWPRPWKWYYEDVHYGRRWGGWRPWWRPQFNELVTTGTAKTDAEGNAYVTVTAAPIEKHEELDLKFVVTTEVSDSSRRVIRGRGEVKVTHAPFFIHPKPARDLYGPGDSVEINVKTENPSGQPVAGAFAVEAWRIERVRKADKDKEGKPTVTFEEKRAQKLHAGQIKIASTGRGSFRFVPDVTGHLRVIVRRTDAKEGQKPVEGTCDLWVASKTGAEAHYAYNDLQIVPSGDQFEIGQKMKVLLNTRFENSNVLLTGEADELLFHRVVHLKRNSTMVEIDVKENLCPNFQLTATLLRDNRLLTDTKAIVVPPTQKFIKVAATLDRGDLGGGEGGKFQPREKTKVRVKLTDMKTGKPVRGQVVLMMVDASVYYIQPEFRERIEKDFYGQTRSVRVQTTNSFAGPAWLTPWHRYYGRRGGFRGREALESDAMAEPMLTAKLGARKDAEGGERPPAPKLAQAIVREHFRDTVLWAGSVVTGEDGTAEVPVTMPDQLTTFALHAISFDEDTRVGQVQSEAITTKRIIVRLESGRFFTEGDHSYVTVIAHNYYPQPQKLKVDLNVGDGLGLRSVKLGGKWRDYANGQALDVTVPAGGEVRLDFKSTALRPGAVIMLARARGMKESDALQLTKPIVPWGARKIAARSGTLRGKPAQPAQTHEFTVEVPRQIGPGSQSLTVTLNPSIAAVALEALPYLARYPYGCVEQTMSRFLPTVLMRKTLQDAGIGLDDIRKHVEAQAAKDPKLAARYKFRRKRMNRNPVYATAEVDRMIAEGLDRLAKFQHADGSWGWWKHSRRDRYITAYVVHGLLVARDCDVKLPAGVLDRGLKRLIAMAEQPKGDRYDDWWWRHMDNDNTRCFMLSVVGRGEPAALKTPKLKAHLDRLYGARDDLTDYGRAYLAMALHAAGRIKEAKTIVENFENTVTIDPKSGDAHWGRTGGWWHWYRGATETTAWVLQAMLTVNPKDKHVVPAVRWLVGNRREVYWHNTKTTATVVYALARYAKVAGELDCDQTYRVFIDGQPQKTVRVTRQNLLTFDDWIDLGADALPPGEHTIKIVREGKGSLYWGAFLRYYDKSDVIKAGGNRVALRREYFRLVPEKFTNTRTVWKNGKSADEKFPDLRHKPEPLPFGAEIASGELVEVRIAIDAEENLEYMIFEDPKPAGCEPYRLRSGSSHGGGVYANMELRDTKVVFFADWLPKGKRTLSYRLVCEQPGTFRILPTAGEAMYSPFVQAISDSGKMDITPKPEKD